MQLVLDTKGLVLQKKRNAFEIISENGSRTISPAKLTSIAITNTVIIHSDAVVLAIKHQIPILFFDNIGKAKARLWSPYFESIATLRRSQIKFAESTEATAWMIEIFELKTDGQISNLKYLKNRRPKFQENISEAISKMEQFSKKFEAFKKQRIEDCRNNLMGVEGNIAKVYWQCIGESLDYPYSFGKRSRQPAEDIFNAAINYGYGMMYAVVEGALFAAGLDPHLGFLHTDAHKKPTLAFDLIEAFRPWVDRLIITICLEQQLIETDFAKNQYGLFLNKSGKATLIPAFNDFLRQERRFLHQQSINKNHIYRLAGLLAKRIRLDDDTTTTKTENGDFDLL